MLKGAGLEVSLDTKAQIDSQREREAPAITPVANNPLRFIRRRLARAAGRAGQPQQSEYIIDETTKFSATPGAKPTLETPGFRQVTASANPSSAPVNLWAFPDEDSTRTPDLLFRGETEIPLGSAEGNHFGTNGVLCIGNGLATSVYRNGPLAFTAGNELRVLSASISPTITDSSTGLGRENTGLALNGGNLLSITDSNIADQLDLKLEAPTIDIAGSSLRSEGSGNLSPRSISVKSPAASAAGGFITIRDSSTLQALSAKSAISLQTNGAPIFIGNSKLQAGQIDIDSIGSSLATSSGSMIQIRHSILSGDVIRASAFNTGDRDALLISNNTFNATQLIQFYADGASNLRFQGENRLNLSPDGVANLIGKTVQVDNGGNVIVNGRANVYRDVDNYNKPGFGNITVSGTQSHQAFSARPSR